MRSLINWSDREVQYPSRYTESDAGSGRITLTPAPGEVRNEGTPQNATNFNTMDLAALEAMLIGAEVTRNLRQIMRGVEALEGLSIDVTLTNTKSYPFNDSVQTVTFSEQRNTPNYYVVPEILTPTNNVGDFVVSDKLLNGFKIAFTGSAASVSVRCHVIGGV